VSFGVSSSTQYDTFDAIVAAADLALLSAKTAGRNRVVVSGGQEQPLVLPQLGQA
jgi:PleD family two-component response regulator